MNESNETCKCKLETQNKHNEALVFASHDPENTGHKNCSKTQRKYFQ